MTAPVPSGNQSFFSGVMTPDVVKETNGAFASSPGDFGDLISPMSTLRKPEANAMRCILYFVLGYAVAG